MIGILLKNAQNPVKDSFMKKIIITVLMILTTKAAYMSGSLEIIPLEESLSSGNSVYIITVTGSFTAKISEIDRIDPSVSQKTAYSAVVNQVYHKENITITSGSEKWHVIFPKSETETLKKIKEKVKRKKNYPEANDVIYIMDFEDIDYSMTYYVRGLHKIFIYHQCKDTAKEIKPGQKYYFISGYESSGNNVLYGGINFGIFPYTEEIGKRIDTILVSNK
jgi:hypothetical protein